MVSRVLTDQRNERELSQCLLAYKQGAGVSLLRRAHALAWQTRLDLQRNRHPRSLFSCPSLLYYPFLLESFLKRKSDFGSGSSALPGSPGISILLPVRGPKYQRDAERCGCMMEYLAWKLAGYTNIVVLYLISMTLDCKYMHNNCLMHTHIMGPRVVAQPSSLVSF